MPVVPVVAAAAAEPVHNRDSKLRLWDISEKIQDAPKTNRRGELVPKHSGL